MLLTLATDTDDSLMNIGTRVSTIMLTILECKSTDNKPRIFCKSKSLAANCIDVAYENCI
jgi:hypothetical protein